MAAETILWLEPDGTSHDLSNWPTLGMLMGRAGAFMPPVEFIEDVVPLQPGARLRVVRTRARDVDLPMHVEAATDSALRQQVRSILKWFDPTRGDGKLRVTAPDAVVRELNCRYSQGLALSESAEAHGVTWQDFVVTLRAWDPYWYATSPTTATYTVVAAPANFFPFFPMKLSAGVIFNNPTITNPGDVVAWPVWTITGPGSAIQLSNATTNRSITLSTVVAAGSVLTIDTRPSKKTITLTPGAQNRYGDLSFGSELWSLAVGANVVSLQMTGATAASAVAVSFTPGYLSP